MDFHPPTIKEGAVLKALLFTQSRAASCMGNPQRCEGRRCQLLCFLVVQAPRLARVSQDMLPSSGGQSSHPFLVDVTGVHDKARGERERERDSERERENTQQQERKRKKVTLARHQNCRPTRAATSSTGTHGPWGLSQEEGCHAGAR